MLYIQASTSYIMITTTGASGYLYTRPFAFLTFTENNAFPMSPCKEYKQTVLFVDHALFYGKYVNLEVIIVDRQMRSYD